MSLTLGLLALVLPVQAMNLDSLDGKWTASVRIDNLFRMDSYFISAVHTDYHDSSSYEGADAAAYLHSEVSTSWGFPTQYSLQWRWRRDLAIGLDGELGYRRTPRTTYRQWADDHRRDSEVSGTEWKASLALEVCKYLKKDSPVSPFLSVAPFVGRLSSKRLSESTSYEAADTLFERSESSIYQTSWGIDLNWGGELFFRLSKAKMGLKLKSNLVRAWTDCLEERTNSDYRREESPLGIDISLPTQGNFSLWLSFYF